MPGPWWKAKGKRVLGAGARGPRVSPWRFAKSAAHCKLTPPLCGLHLRETSCPLTSGLLALPFLLSFGRVGGGQGAVLEKRESRGWLQLSRGSPFTFPQLAMVEMVLSVLSGKQGPGEKCLGSSRTL